MSSTNKTSNYNLSQFVGSDKPAWLTDYNQDMSKIDTGVKNAADTATAADGKADANTTSIGELGYLSTTAKNNLVSAINEVDANADTANEVATQASNTAGAAQTNVTNLAQMFNLSATAYTYQDAAQISGAAASIDTAGGYWVAKNTSGTLCKIYGNLNIKNTSSSGSCTIRLVSDSGLRPATDIEVTGCCDAIDTNPISNNLYIRRATYTIKTTGEIDVTFNKSANEYTTLRMYACLIFVKDFGDQPE